MTTAPARRRTGARRPDLVPVSIRCDLECSRIETANLMEQIAMSLVALAESAFPEAPPHAALADPRFLHRMRAGGHVVLSYLGVERLNELVEHPSDTVRAWGALAVGLAPCLDLADCFGRVRPFADDAHFAVREWAWLSLRPKIGQDLIGSIDYLTTWAMDPSPRIRRFAIEATRPRSVWGGHLPLLKTSPNVALPLLQAVAGDRDRYVQDAVSNWLNDASKTKPDWVIEICTEWSRAHPTPDGERMRRRALRSIRR